jgi:hypothetical protein
MKSIVICLLVFLMCAQAASAQVATPAEATRQPERDPGAEALRSAVFPGWGQHRLGAPEKGWGYFSGAAVMLLFVFDVIAITDSENSKEVLRGMGLIGYGFMATLSAADAYSRSERLNRENGYLLDGPDARARGEGGVRIALWQRRF